MNQVPTRPDTELLLGVGAGSIKPAKKRPTPQERCVDGDDVSEHQKSPRPRGDRGLEAPKEAAVAATEALLGLEHLGLLPLGERVDRGFVKAVVLLAREAHLRRVRVTHPRPTARRRQEPDLSVQGRVLPSQRGHLGGEVGGESFRQAELPFEAGRLPPHPVALTLDGLEQTVRRTKTRDSPPQLSVCLRHRTLRAPKQRLDCVGDGTRPCRPWAATGRGELPPGRVLGA
mmetsp:Transcript_64435/g.145326  ORF Transcript_64435/g.145326 Transcript_64435/m.145326 type:complete len:230 (-) Transcript_64435:54-743(-)